MDDAGGLSKSGHGVVMLIVGKVGTYTYLSYVLSIRRTRMEDGTPLDVAWRLRRPFSRVGIPTMPKPVIQGSADGGESTLQGA